MDVEGTSTYSVRVVDVRGQVVYVTKHNGGLNHIDVSAWKSGMYLVSIETDDFVANKSFLKR
jgi:hypothetical protein